MSSLYPLKLKHFKRKSGIDFTPTSFRLWTWSSIIIIALSILEETFYLGLNPSPLAFIWLMCIIGATAWGRVEIEHKHGSFDGHIEFSEEGFSTDSKVLLWEKTEITNLQSSLIFRDDIYSYRYLRGPKYSLGVDNFIEFKTGSETERIYFQFSDYKDKRSFEKIIRDQFYKGNIGLSVTYDGLNLTYEEIQVLKEEAKSKQNNANQQQYLH